MLEIQLKKKHFKLTQNYRWSYKSNYNIYIFVIILQINFFSANFLFLVNVLIDLLLFVTRFVELNTTGILLWSFKIIIWTKINCENFSLPIEIFWYKRIELIEFGSNKFLLGVLDFWSTLFCFAIFFLKFQFQNHLIVHFCTWHHKFPYPTQMFFWVPIPLILVSSSNAHNSR